MMRLLLLSNHAEASMNEVYVEFILMLAYLAGVCLVRSVCLFFAVVEYLLMTDRFFMSREGSL